MKQRMEWKKRLLEWELTDPANGLWISFFVPVFTMLCLFLVHGVYPFGDRTFLRSDMYSQYAPFFMEFYRKLHGGGSLWYTWNLGMGVNFWAIWVYYLAAPWNWLVFFFPEHLIIEFMTGLMVLKMGLCGLTMTWYLRKHCGTKSFDTAAFGCIYGLSGFIVAYGWNLMWLDCLWLLPLILSGLERLMDGAGGLLYCLLLGVAILCNYYISIMLCIFLALCFVARMVLTGELSDLKNPDRRKCFLRTLLAFIGYSVLAAGLSGVLLIPELQAVRIAGSGNNPFPERLQAYFGVGDLLLRHVAFAIPTGLEEWGSHLPNLYCGSVVFVLVPVFFLSGGISRREKIICGGFLVLFWLSFSFNILDYIWHGFHFPRGLPGRQSFLYIFLVLTLCCKGYLGLREIPGLRFAAVFLGAVVLVIALMVWNQREEYCREMFFSELIFLGVYGGLVWLLKSRRYSERKLRLWFFLVTFADIFCYMNLWGCYTTDRTEYLEGNRECAALVEKLCQSPDLFRVQTEKRLTDNDGALTGLPDISIFSSTAYEDMQALFQKLEGQASPVAYGRYGDTPLENMLFAVRYRIGKGEDYGSWKKVSSDEESGLRVFENPFALPLGFWVDSSFETAWQNAVGNTVEKQNLFLEELGIEAPLWELKFEDGTSDTRIFYPEWDGYYQVLMESDIKELVVIKSDTERILNNVSEGTLLDLGFCRRREQIILTTEEKNPTIAARPYYYSEAEMGIIFDRLSQYPWELSSQSDTRLEGTISCPTGGTLMTTIPFDPGWTVIVDGEEQKPEKMLGAFLGVPLSAGSHCIRMEFRPEGFTAGLWLSLASAVVLLTVIQKNQKIKKIKKGQKVCRIFWPCCRRMEKMVRFKISIQ